MTRSVEVNSALYFRPPGGCLGAKRLLSNQWYENSCNGVHTPALTRWGKYRAVRRYTWLDI